MHGDYVDRTIFHDTKIYYFDVNTYNGYNEFIVDSCVHCEDTLQYHDHSVIP